MTDVDDLLDLVMRLYAYGRARDRATDREVRTISITDDEAMMLLTVLGTFDHPLIEAMRIRGDLPGMEATQQ